MGDFFQTLVDVEVGPGDGAAAAERLRRFLIERGIVQPTLTPSVLGGGGLGHPPGPSYAAACVVADDLTLQLVTNGVAVEAGPQVAVDPQGEQTIECSSCRSSRAASEDFWAAISDWYDGNAGLFPCADCGAANTVRDWNGDPPFAVGHATITFWNWPRLADGFKDELRALVEHKLVCVTGKV